MIPTACIGGTRAAQVNRTANFEMSTGRYLFTTGDKYFAMDGVFTGEFRSYELLFHWYTGTTNGAMSLFRKAGVEIAPASGYGYSALYTNGGAVAVSAGAGPNANFPAVGALGFSGSLIISEPMFTSGNTNPKPIRGDWSHYLGTPAQTICKTWLGGYDTQALDGFAMMPSDQAQVGMNAGSYGFMSVRGLA
jgi:hypothetical protein